MPTKNKPKRFNRHRSTRVARRKRRRTALLTGNKRNRAPRPKKKDLEKLDQTSQEKTAKTTTKKSETVKAKKEE